LAHTTTNNDNHKASSKAQKEESPSSVSNLSKEIPQNLTNINLNGSLLNANGSSIGKCSLAAKNVVSIKCSGKDQSPMTKIVDDQLKEAMNKTIQKKEFSFPILSKVDLKLRISPNGPDDFIIGKTIGKGAYAYVNIAIHKESRTKMALKIYEKSKLNTAQRIRGVINEITILTNISHPNIVKIYEVFETENHLVLAEEFVGGTSLLNLLKSKYDRRLDESEAKGIFHEMASAVQFLHLNGIAHRDLKLENVLLDENSHVKLIDFGFSTCLGPAKKIKIFCGTPSYMAPEIILKKEHLGQSAYIWALGVLLFAMMNGCFPFKGSDDDELYSQIVDGYFIYPYIIPNKIKSLISSMILVDTDKRIKIDEVQLIR